MMKFPTEWKVIKFMFQTTKPVVEYKGIETVLFWHRKYALTNKHRGTEPPMLGVEVRRG